MAGYFPNNSGTPVRFTDARPALQVFKSAHSPDFFPLVQGARKGRAGHSYIIYTCTFNIQLPWNF